jgi:hypothetical protein
MSNLYGEHTTNWTTIHSWCNSQHRLVSSLKCPEQVWGPPCKMSTGITEHYLLHVHSLCAHTQLYLYFTSLFLTQNKQYLCGHAAGSPATNHLSHTHTRGHTILRTSFGYVLLVRSLTVGGWKEIKKSNIRLSSPFHGQNGDKCEEEVQAEVKAVPPEQNKLSGLVTPPFLATSGVAFNSAAIC